MSFKLADVSESEGTTLIHSCLLSPLEKFTITNSAHLNGNDLEMSGASKSAGEGLDAHEPYFHRDHLSAYVLYSALCLILIQLWLHNRRRAESPVARGRYLKLHK